MVSSIRAWRPVSRPKEVFLAIVPLCWQTKRRFSLDSSPGCRDRAKGLGENVRYEAQVRATRAYLAGLGTSGSLLAGAAAMFVLASAIVAFRGWPQVGDQPAPVAVQAAHATVGAAPSRADRLLIAATARAGTATAAGSGGVRAATGAPVGRGNPGGSAGSTAGGAVSSTANTAGGAVNSLTGGH